MDERQRDSLKVVVTSLAAESERLRSELSEALGKRDALLAKTGAQNQAPPTQQAGWAGLTIGEPGQPAARGWPSDSSDSMTDSADSANSWLIFPELSPLEQTDLSVSFAGDDLDQSSVRPRLVSSAAASTAA